MTKNNDEKKIIGASYLFTFYREVYSLTQLNANYSNQILQLEVKYNSEVLPDGLEATERDLILNLCQSLRYSANIVYIQYKSIGQAIKDFPLNPKIDEVYNKLKKQFIVNRLDSEEFTILINSLLVGGIIKSLLESNSDLINSIYNDEQ